MILERKKLFTSTLGGEWRLEKTGRVFLCRSEFRRLFSIPTDVSTIWVSIRDRPTAFSMALKIEHGYYCWAVQAENGGRWLPSRLFDDVRLILKKYAGRTVYLEVEYYEPKGTSDDDSGN